MHKFLILLVIILCFCTSYRGSADDQPSQQGLPGIEFLPPQNSLAAVRSDPPPSSTQLPTGKSTLQLRPIPDYINKKGYGVLEGIIYPPGQQYTGKLPVAIETLHDPRTGIFLTQPPIGFILYRSAANAAVFDHILIDSNLNDTLADEEPLSIPDITRKTPLQLYFSDKPTIFDLKFSSKGLKLYPKYWREGKITLNGQAYNAAIFKSTYGTDYTYGTILLIDFDNDGRYTPSPYELLTEAFLLQPQLVLKDNFYTSAITPDGSSLTLQKLESAYGQITFTLPAGSDKLESSYKFSFLPQGGSGRDILKVALKQLPITLPQGKYSIIEGLVYGADFRVLLKFACPEFTILKNKRLKLKLNSAKMEALARQVEDKLIAAQKTYGPRDIYFNLVGPADINDPGPELLVYNTNNPAEIFFDDKLEYG